MDAYVNKFIHIRQVNQDLVLSDVFELSNTGGLTVVYTCTNDDVFFSVACCSQRDQFSRTIGRKVALERLLKEGPLDILAAVHPIGDSIIEWIELNYFDKPVKIFRLGYKWVSTFEEMA